MQREMTDIALVRTLYAEIERLNDALTDYHRVKALGRADAADNARLRAALEEIERQGGAEDTLAAIARRALEPKP